MKKLNTASLPYIGAFAQALLFTFAGVKAFDTWGWLIGPGVGITASLSVAVASSGIGSITAKGRKQLATVGLILMGVFSASTIALSIAAPQSVWCAVSWGCAVDVSIVLAGAISGKGLVATEDKPKKVSETVAKPKRNPEKVARQPISNDTLLAYFAGNPGATDTQVAQHFGVTRQAIGKRREKLYKVDAS